MGAGIIGANELIQAIKTAGEIGAGEIALNDVGRDGTMSGTNISRLREVRNQTNLPIIQSCGIGKTAHFVEAFENGADAVAVGTFFAFVDQNFIQIRSHIRNSGIDIRS
jgi:cyclase